MGSVVLCLGLSFSSVGAEIPDDIEDFYQKKIKKIISFLYSHQEMSIVIFISGVLLDWIEKKHEEAVNLLSELIDRKQVEILGGGYYEPLFPLILPADRVAQIEYLTTCVRKALGKRPRGIFLTESIWDPALISSFNTCGMEYTLLDSRLIPQSQFRPIPLFSPLIVEDMGRTITVIPLQQDCLPHPQQSPIKYLSFCRNIAQSGEKSVISGFFTPDEFLDLIENKWLDDFISLVTADQIAEFSLPHRFLKSCQSLSKAYIPAGCLSDAALWTLEACVPHTRVFTEAIRPTVRDFLSVYPEALNLYSRMMYVSMLINQCRGDKIRKKAAREHLWAAQNFAVYMYKGRGGITDIKLRYTAYRRLLQAEKLVREASDFTENSSTLDLTMNGKRDYIFCFETYNAFISLQGGIVFELDIMQNYSNYCLAGQRLARFDGIGDMYLKKMFIDHLLDNIEFTNFISGNLSDASLFSCADFTEVHFNRLRNELSLKTGGLWGKNEIPVSLKKRYVFTSNGILVQYILKNEGNLSLQAKFAVEQNISVAGGSGSALSAEIVMNENKEVPCSDQTYVRQAGVSLVQLTDTAENVSFIFEPNEAAGFYLEPLFTVCPGAKTGENKQYEAHTTAFYWDVNIPPGYETEKTLYLTIKTAKKPAVAKKRKTR